MVMLIVGGQCKAENGCEVYSRYHCSPVVLLLQAMFPRIGKKCLSGILGIEVNDIKMYTHQLLAPGKL